VLVILAWIGLILISVWVHKDAGRRGNNATAWAIGTFLLVIIVLPLYLIMRNEEYETPQEDGRQGIPWRGARAHPIQW